MFVGQQTINEIALSWTHDKFVNVSRRVFAYIWCQIFFWFDTNQENNDNWYTRNDDEYILYYVVFITMLVLM